MFGYYTALLIITASIAISAITVIFFDDMLDKLNRNVFISAYTLLLFSYIFEWLAVYLERTNSTLNFLTTFSMSFVLFVAPSIMVIIAWGIDDTKSKLFSSIVYTNLALNFMLGFSGLFSNAIFYYDAQNLYHRGEFFYLHFVMVLFSTLLLFINTYRLGLKFQSKNNYILIIDLLLLLGGLFIQFNFDGIWVLWISSAIAITLLYIYYSSLVNQIDILTGLLNRKCYDSQLYDLKTNAIILFFDVNKFKEINDTQGHAMGDYCLVEIANAIKEVYGKSGYCYRIGGDEFSVILYKNLDLLEVFNSKFSQLLFEKEYKFELPTVSIGHSYYYPNKSSIQKVIEEADAMMYVLKKRNSLTDII